MNRLTCAQCGGPLRSGGYYTLVQTTTSKAWFHNALIHDECAPVFRFRVISWMEDYNLLESCWQLDAVIPRGVPTD